MTLAVAVDVCSKISQRYTEHSKFLSGIRYRRVLSEFECEICVWVGLPLQCAHRSSTDCNTSIEFFNLSCSLPVLRVAIDFAHWSVTSWVLLLADAPACLGRTSPTVERVPNGRGRSPAALTGARLPPDPPLLLLVHTSTHDLLLMVVGALFGKTQHKAGVL